MAADSIQQNNLAWQLRNSSRNISEWVQLQFSQSDFEPDISFPNVSFPVWIGRLLFWGIIAAGVLWLAWIILQLVDRYLGNRAGRPRGPVMTQPLVEVEHHTAAHWMNQAKAFERQGNWAAACRAFYLAALQLLHDRSLIVHQLSRTDGEYLRGIQALTKSHPLQLLIRTHERSLFGADALTAENAQRCRHACEDVKAG